MLRTFIALLIGLGWFATAVAETPPRPAALVTSVSGSVRLPAGAVSIGQALYEGQTLNLNADGRITLLYANGQIVEYRGVDTSTLSVGHEAARGVGIPHLGGGTSEAAGAIFEARSRGVTNGEMVFDDLRAGTDGVPLGPRDESVRTRAVAFKWKGERGVVYRFVLRPVAQPTPLVETTVKGLEYNCELRLSPATRYVWSAAQPGAEAEHAHFQTLSAADEASLQRAEASLGSALDPGSRAMLLGLLYERYGLYHEAIVQLTLLGNRDPRNAWVQGELAWLYYQVGDVADARVHFDAAHH